MADEPGSSDPQRPTAAPPPPQPPAEEPAATGPETTVVAVPPPPPGPNPVTTAWAALDATSRMIAGAGIATIAVLLLGALVNAWDSTDFLLIALVAAVAATATAWYTSNTNAGPKPSPLPLATIEFAAGAVASVLAVLNLVELIFDLDQLDDFGGILGVLMTLALAVTSLAILAGAERRDPTLRSPRRYGDTGTRLALSGLALVLIGWAINLSVGYWTMRQAALPLALLTSATVLVIVAPKWTPTLPGIPLAWVGAGFAALALLLAIGQWGSLMDLGSTQVELGIFDLLGFLVYLIGIVLTIVGGVLAGLAARPKREPSPAVPDDRPDAAVPATPDTVEADVPVEGNPTGSILRPPRAAGAGRRTRHSARPRPPQGSPGRSPPVRDHRGRDRRDLAGSRAQPR